MSIVRTSLSILLLAAFLGACGSDGETDASGEAPARRAQAAPPVMGSFELPDTTFHFRVTGCDLTGTGKDGIMLRGTGTMPDGRSLMPDGRMLLIEVERLITDMAGAGSVYERATVQFGGFAEEDGWEATAMGRDGSTWTTGDMMGALDGPIIQVSGNDLVVAGTYKHASRDERLEGRLSVTCPRSKYP